MPGQRLRWGWALVAVSIVAMTGALRAQDDGDAYHQALLNYKAGNYAAARLAIDDAQTADPKNVTVAVLKGRVMTEQKDFADGETLLRRFLTEQGPIEVQLALGDLFLRERNWGAAANMYDQSLNLKPGDPDVMLKFIYAKINTADLVTAAKIASELKPLDPVNPSYYFARAALAEATGRSSEAEQDIETVRTIYGITVANRYLKTYLEVSSTKPKTGVAPAADSPNANGAPSQTAP